MVTGFTKQEEGVKAYADIGRPYPDEVFDGLYEEWLRETSADDLSKYSHHKTQEISKIIRVRTKDNKEFLVYSLIEYRLDKALNVKHFWRPNLGRYPIPIPIYATTDITFGKQNRKIVDILNIETGYSIPFTKKNLDKIRDIGLIEPNGKVQYMVENPQGLKTSVATYDDLRNEEDFNALVHFGRSPTTKQREAWLEKEGLEKDLDRLQQIQSSRMDTGTRVVR
jgi:hypothetical protein